MFEVPVNSRFSKGFSESLLLDDARSAGDTILFDLRRSLAERGGYLCEAICSSSVVIIVW